MITPGSYVQIDRLMHRIIRVVREGDLKADPSNYGIVWSEGEDTVVVWQAGDDEFVLYHKEANEATSVPA